MNSFNEAFEDLIKDMHNAEKQITKALPKMAKMCSNEQLRMGFEQHLQETEEQIKRLEKVAEICGFKPTGKVCPAMQGLVEEGNEHMKEGKPGPLMDAVLIASAQKVEHYEICSYGTAKAWAELLGFQEAAEILGQTLQEEEQTDQKLNQLAEGGINQAACDAPVEEDSKRTTRKTTASKSSTSSRSKSTGTRSRAKAGANR